MINPNNSISNPDAWEDEFPLSVLLTVFEPPQLVFAFFRGVEVKPIKYGNRVTSNDILREVEKNMAAKGKKNGLTANGNIQRPDSNGSGGSIRWVNLNLSNEDVQALEQSDATLEYLATRCMASVSSRSGLSVRYRDDGKSISATFTCQLHTGDGDTTYGFSGFGGTIRDALLTLVYKLDIFLDGDFDNLHQLYTVERDRRRFG